MSEFSVFYLGRKYFLIIIVFSFTFIGLYIFRIELSYHYALRNCILWNKNVKINYNDFRKNPDNNSNLELYYYHIIALKQSIITKAKAEAYFDRDKSWIKDSTNLKKSLIVQKIVFDLTEYYARKINNEINRKGFDRNGNQKPFTVLEKIRDSICVEYSAVSDSISNFNQNNIDETIKYWKPKVEKMLINSKK